MKYLFFLVLIQSYVFAQTYGVSDPNRGPDHGIAKNFSWLAPNGIPVLPYVRSEITLTDQTYSYIRTGLSDFKLSRKKDEEFYDLIPKLRTSSSGDMDEYSRLLNIYEDKESLNIYSWGVRGYNFLFYQKRVDGNPRLIRFGYIRNSVHGMELFDDSIKSLEFTGAKQLKITKEPATEGQKRLRPYLFQSPGIYEFRPDGVYLDGIFDPTVADHEPQDVVDENIQKDPQHYLKKQALHAERVASYTKEIMDAEAARVAALAPQPTPKPSVNPTPPEPNPEPAVAPSPIPKTPPATIESESSSNLTPWLAGIVAGLVLLLGYLGFWIFTKKASP